jgi:hypothetical protein
MKERVPDARRHDKAGEISRKAALSRAGRGMLALLSDCSPRSLDDLLEHPASGRASAAVA